MFGPTPHPRTSLPVGSDPSDRPLVPRPSPPSAFLPVPGTVTSYRVFPPLHVVVRPYRREPTRRSQSFPVNKSRNSLLTKRGSFPKSGNQNERNKQKVGFFSFKLWGRLSCSLLRSPSRGTRRRSFPFSDLEAGCPTWCRVSLREGTIPLSVRTSVVSLSGFSSGSQDQTGAL